MKKLLVIFGFFLVMLSSCESAEIIKDCKDNPLVGNECIDITSPVIFGVADFVIDEGDDFNIQAGITANDDMDGDITGSLVIEENFNHEEAGVYLIKYISTDSAGNETIALQYITVTKVYTYSGNNLVTNGDFTTNLHGWTYYNNVDDGSALFNQKDGKMQIIVLSVPESYPWVPRTDFSGMTFEQGKSYQVSFEAYSLEPRMIYVQIGELINEAPWFVDFISSYNKQHLIETDVTTYSFIFEMTFDTTDNAGILFEFGKIGNGNFETTVYIDNVVIQEVE
ncbi:carbohydrate binding domain-containing protein [Candidatus Izimaplasma bacterium]|nr:carbohydrate binding domain-containing protein [Candidatus Izimaplasma bacterium]